MVVVSEPRITLIAQMGYDGRHPFSPGVPCLASLRAPIAFGTSPTRAGEGEVGLRRGAAPPLHPHPNPLPSRERGCVGRPHPSRRQVAATNP